MRLLRLEPMLYVCTEKISFISGVLVICLFWSCLEWHVASHGICLWSFGTAAFSEFGAESYPATDRFVVSQVWTYVFSGTPRLYEFFLFLNSFPVYML
jgi:type IV secretory pathway TrbD component